LPRRARRGPREDRRCPSLGAAGLAPHPASPDPAQRQRPQRGRIPSSGGARAGRERRPPESASAASRLARPGRSAQRRQLGWPRGSGDGPAGRAYRRPEALSPASGLARPGRSAQRRELGRPRGSGDGPAGRAYRRSEVPSPTSVLAGPERAAPGRDRRFRGSGDGPAGRVCRRSEVPSPASGLARPGRAARERESGRFRGSGGGLAGRACRRSEVRLPASGLARPGRAARERESGRFRGSGGGLAGRVCRCSGPQATAPRSHRAASRQRVGARHRLLERRPARGEARAGSRRSRSPGRFELERSVLPGRSGARAAPGGGADRARADRRRAQRPSSPFPRPVPKPVRARSARARNRDGGRVREGCRRGSNRACACGPRDARPNRRAWSLRGPTCRRQRRARARGTLRHPVAPRSARKWRRQPSCPSVTPLACRPRGTAQVRSPSCRQTPALSPSPASCLKAMNGAHRD
jgi:hypothetical protein